jgi:hypothetical protein
MCGDTEVVKKFLSHHTISKLWPLVLLHVWQNFADRNEIFLVLSFLLEQCKVCIWWFLRFNLYVVYKLIKTFIPVNNLPSAFSSYVLLKRCG